MKRLTILTLLLLTSHAYANEPSERNCKYSPRHGEVESVKLFITGVTAEIIALRFAHTTPDRYFVMSKIYPDQKTSFREFANRPDEREALKVQANPLSHLLVTTLKGGSHYTWILDGLSFPLECGT